MSSIVTAMRAAVDAALRADAGLVAAFAPSNVRLYPLAPPTNPTFPYILYRIETIGDDTECAGGDSVTVSLDVYAREATYVGSAAKAEAIGGAVRKTLNLRLTLSGHTVDDWTFDFDRPLGDPDMLTEHRALQLTFLTSTTA